MKRFVTIFVAVLAAVFTAAGQRQQAQSPRFLPLDWHLRALGADSLHGADVYRAYDRLAGRGPKQKIVVAIIGSGFDAGHEDLAPNLWTNSGEIPADGIDNDGNGYADDIHGWNFLATRDGRMITRTAIEAERFFMQNRARYDELYARRSKSKKKRLKRSEQAEYDRLVEVFMLSTVGESYVGLNNARDIMPVIEAYDREMRRKFPDPADRTPANFASIIDKDDIADNIKHLAYSVMYYSMALSGKSWDEAYESRGRIIEDTQKINEQEKVELADDRHLAGDDINDIDDRSYGNANLLNPFTRMGTHIAGIIGAKRGNDIGMDGIADAVELMLIRAVPSGDEYDKDVALAIRYAVDNGARVVAMPFGKSFSSNPRFVEEAMSYAGSKGVLLVHAAGDSSLDTDSLKLYPLGTGPDGRRLSNYIRVGSSDAGGNLSENANFGVRSVDLFAPGQDIYSTAPSDNYVLMSGSGIAGGVVAGIAALLWSRFPELSAGEMRELLTGSATPMADPRGSGIVNAFEAVKQAEKATGVVFYDFEAEQSVIDSALRYMISPANYPVPDTERFLAAGHSGVTPFFRGFCSMWQGWLAEDNERLTSGLGAMLGHAAAPEEGKAWSLVTAMLDNVLATGTAEQTRAVIGIIDSAGERAAQLENKKKLFEGKATLIEMGLD